MLQFFDYSVTYDVEVPDEVCLNFHLAECQNRCAGCSSPELWKSTNVMLSDVYHDLVEAYFNRITCVCFLGEGRNTVAEHLEFEQICDVIHKMNLKTCLYCGRDCTIETWMKIFDYLKIGSYRSEKGDLSYPTTNQKLFQNINGIYHDITYRFWK